FQKYEITIYLGEEKQSVTIEASSFVIGRSNSADITIKNDLVSREHLKVFLQGDEVFIEELGSSNGSWFKDKKLRPKKYYAYENLDRITLGNSTGPSLSINCIFDVEELPVEVNSVEDDSVSEFEEITLVRHNLLNEQIKIESNIVNLRSQNLAKDALDEMQMPKVANGNYSEASHSRKLPISKSIQKQTGIKLINEDPTSVGAEPDLLLQMKNLLNFEVQKVERESKKEADEIRSASQKYASDLIKKAQHEAHEVRSIAQKETEALRQKVQREVEKLKENNAKNIETLQFKAKNESEELIEIATKEVAEMRLYAQNFADDLILKARDKSDKMVKETEYITRLKLEETRKEEVESDKNIQRLSEFYQDLKIKVDHLKQTEHDSILNCEILTKNIADEEERMSFERTNLENFRAELSKSKKECEQQLADLKYEERSVKAQMETELLEHKLQVSQVLAESKLAQIQKETIGPEVAALKHEKEKIERQIKDCDWEYQQKMQKIDQVIIQQDLAMIELNSLKTKHAEILSDIEKQKFDFSNEQEKLLLDKKELSEKILKAHNLSIETSEKITLELQLFETQKAEMLIALNKEKQSQLKNIEEETQKLRSIQLEEIQVLKNQKDKAILDSEKSVIESIAAHDQFIKKNKEDAHVIQKAITEDIKKLKEEAKFQTMQLKNRFDNMVSQLERDHQDIKKSLNADIMRLESSKKFLEQELKSVESSRIEKIARMDQEIKDLQAETSKKSALITSKAESEFNEQKASLIRLKEEEAKEIKEMKEKALKEIYGKKAERAKAVSTNVDTLVLTELLKYRNKKISDEFISNCSKEINALVYDTLMDRVGVDRNKLEFAQKSNSKARESALVFKARLYLGTFILLCVVSILMLPKFLSSPEAEVIKTFIKKNFIK
ncbi:MAG: FHA domain-containing protein, partial [Bacteriovorax sp.]|nr:FHA domain-containing protein [Bacteriovorax sp.]